MNRYSVEISQNIPTETSLFQLHRDSLHPVAKRARAPLSFNDLPAPSVQRKLPSVIYS